jgi:hypothetical protein
MKTMVSLAKVRAAYAKVFIALEKAQAAEKYYNLAQSKF